MHTWFDAQLDQKILDGIYLESLKSVIGILLTLESLQNENRILMTLESFKNVNKILWTL